MISNTLTLEELLEGIRFIELGKKSHRGWAEYFEANPEIEKQYLATGDWDDAKTHRDWVRAYTNVLKVLNDVLAEKLQRNPATHVAQVSNLPAQLITKN